jgi:hypothetical protein
MLVKEKTYDRDQRRAARASQRGGAAQKSKESSLQWARSARDSSVLVILDCEVVVAPRVLCAQKVQAQGARGIQRALVR